MLHNARIMWSMLGLNQKTTQSPASLGPCRIACGADPLGALPCQRSSARRILSYSQTSVLIGSDCTGIFLLSVYSRSAAREWLLAPPPPPDYAWLHRSRVWCDPKTIEGRETTFGCFCYLFEICLCSIQHPLSISIRSCTFAIIKIMYQVITL